MRTNGDQIESLGNVPMRLRRSAAINLTDAEAMLLLRFSDEVKRAAISCSILLSCINSVAISKGLRLPSNIGNFSPSQPQSFEAVQQSPLIGLLTPPVRAGLKGFSLFLASTRDEYARLIRMSDARGSICKADVETASEIVSSTACFAKVALKDLVAIHHRLFREFDMAELNYHAGLLDDVLEGETPLLADGKLIEVRTDFTIRDVRVLLNAEALVALSERVERVIVRNISQGGLGFEAAEFIATGQNVEIKLSNSGRRLEGRVVWKVGAKAGVEFFERLTETDPLLAI